MRVDEAGELAAADKAHDDEKERFDAVADAGLELRIESKSSKE